MAEDGSAKETRAVIEALEAVTRMEDPVARARAISEVLSYVSKHEKPWRDDRRKTVLRLLKEHSYRKVAAMIKVSLGTVQSIERGHAGAWRTKPRTKPEESTPEPDGG